MATLQLWFCTLLLGPAIGSFCGVLLHRLPRRESLWYPGSHCLSCGHALRLHDLVPIVSYLYLHGRCRYCRQGFPPAYALVEAAVALLSALGALAGWPGLLAALCASVLLCSLAGLYLRTYCAPSQHGNTLLEIALAAGLLGLTLVAALGLFWRAGADSQVAYRRAVSTGLAVSLAEAFRLDGHSYDVGPQPCSLPVTDYSCKAIVLSNRADVTVIQVTVTSSKLPSFDETLYVYSSARG